MAHLLRMPEVSANMTEAILEAWALKEGDSFSTGDILATIETEKAVVDVEAEADGTLLRTLVLAGSKVAVGAPIALIAEPAETVGDIDTVLNELGAAAATQFEEGQDSVAADALAGEDPTVVAQEARVDQDSATGSAVLVGSDGEQRIFASPLARKLAKEAGIDFQTLTGTGPGGRIRKRDVEAALSTQGATTSPTEPAQAADSEPTLSAAPGRVPAAAGRSGKGALDAPFEEVEHSGMRRAVATRLTESKQAVPHFYVHGSALVDDLIKLRAKINGASEVKVSFNDLVLKAAARAHVAHPDVNVIWTEDAIRQYGRVDISVAIASERGLVTPVVRGVESMTVTAVARTVRDFVDRANSGKLRQDELEGGSLSLSNLGMYGTEQFSAIINPPQAAILAVGAIREEPVAMKGKVKVRNVLKFVLSVDHRPVDGAAAAAWMQTFVAILENPLRIIT